jgi:hypothetical protein
VVLAAPELMPAIRRLQSIAEEGCAVWTVLQLVGHIDPAASHDPMRAQVENLWPNDFWWRFRDSNPGPADYDSVALTD